MDLEDIGYMVAVISFGFVIVLQLVSYWLIILGFSDVAELLTLIITIYSLFLIVFAIVFLIIVRYED